MSDKHPNDPAPKQEQADQAADGETRQQLAISRTDMAEDRTIMAIERTFAGWIRTAFAAIGIGLAFHVLFNELQPHWLAKAIATLFIAFAVFLAIDAEKRASRALERMRNHAVERPDLPRFKLLAYGVATGAAALIAGLWILNGGTIGG